MAKLPQASDYGNRVGLRSNRIDTPGQGEMAVANALDNAAQTFVGMAIEHKQKDDALSYANAKNDYMIADIQEREKLKHDQDFSTHDSRYREAMKGHYDRLFTTVRTDRDRGLFDAEARLMNERGSVAVGDNSRTKELDWHKGKFAEASANAKEIILAADDAQTAQDAMFSVLEHATALRDKGILDEDEYQAELQAWVQDASFSRLIAMDPKQRQEVLERSITARKTSGEPITKEQIMEGKGTGSIADFLHLDTAVKMLEETQTENEIDDELTAAYAIADLAADNFPTNPQEQQKWARAEASRQNIDGTTRQRLESIIASRGTEFRNNKNDMQDRVLTSATQLMSEVDEARGRPWTYEEIPASELKVLEPHQRNALQAYSRSMEEGRQGFAQSNQLVLDDGGGKSWALWRNMTEAEKSAAPLDSADWKGVLTQDVWMDMKKEQDNVRSKPGSSSARYGGLTNVQMVTSAIVRMGHVPQVGRTIEDSQSYQMLLFQMDRAVQERMDEKGGNLTNTERNQVLSEILKPMAFTDDYGGLLGPDSDPEDMVPIAAMSVKQRKTGRLAWKGAITEVHSVSPSGITTTYEKALQKMATSLGVKPGDDDYERAYFAMKYGEQFGWGYDEIEARLLGVGE